MRSKSVSPLGTLLTIASVLAVPLLAIFGIPQFVPVAASSSPSVAAPTPLVPSDGSRRQVEFCARDIFAPVETRPAHSPASAQPIAAIGSGWSGISNDTPVTSDVPALDRVTDVTGLGEPFTWRMAVAKLNSLGIRQFRLEPSVAPEAFRFCCYLTPVGDARVSVRFEAEDEEPLQAVKNVLDQVAQWGGRR